MAVNQVSMRARAPVSRIACLAVLATWTHSGMAIGADLPPTEIYLDLHTMTLSGKLLRGAKSVNKVAVIAPVGSSAILQYWEREERVCESSPGSTPATTVSGAPTGAALDVSGVPSQKLVFEVSHLKVTNTDYCFRLNLDKKLPIGDAQRTLLEVALRRTLEKLATRTPGASCGTFLPPSAVAVTPSDIAHMLQCELYGSSFSVAWEGAEKVDITEAVQKILVEDRMFRDRFQLTLNQLVSYDRVWNNLEEKNGPSTNPGMRTLQALVDSARNRTAAYRPLDGLQPAELSSAIKDPALKAQFSDAVLASPDSLLTVLERNRAALRADGVLDRLKQKKTSHDVLSAALAYESKMENITFDPVAVRELQGRLAAAIRSRDAAAVTANVAALRRLTHGWEVLAVDQANQPRPGFERSMRTSDGPLIRDFVAVVQGLDTLHQEMARDGSKLDELFASTEYQRVLSRATQVPRWESIESVPIAGAKYADRFPFYASFDLGLATAFLRGPSGDPSRTTLAAYFGINFYFHPVDKDEELGFIFRSEKLRFFDRFSLTGGMTFTNLASATDLGVDGAIGDKMPLFGAGIRISDYLRASGGVVLYTQSSPSRLNDEKHIKPAPYFGVSMDLDLFTEIKKAYDSATK